MDESPKSAAAAPAIALPKGGGAIRGLGEKFAANPVTGTGAMTVPLPLSPGRSELGPKLSLGYDSGSGNGPFGFGWSLSLPSISRKTEKGLPRYRDANESDVFILSGAEDLVPLLNEDGTRFVDEATDPAFIIHRYRPRVEGLFARIERWTERATGSTHWRSLGRDNVTTIYGRGNARVSDPSDPARTFRWLISETWDDRGNAVVYEYAAEDDASLVRGANERNRVRSANRYLKRILYGNRVSRLVDDDLSNAQWLFEAVFDYDQGHYEELPLAGDVPAGDQHHLVRAASTATRPWATRPDPFSSYRSGFEIRTYRRCRRVLMFHRFAELGAEPCLVRSLELDYGDPPDVEALTIEEELAHRGSTRFGSFVQSITMSGYVRDAAIPPVQHDGLTFVTYIRKSLPPLEFAYSKTVIDDTLRTLDPADVENVPAGVDGKVHQFADLDGEGIPGILSEQDRAWYYKANRGGGHFAPAQLLAGVPSAAGARSGRQQLLDLAGDGRLDFVAFSGPTPGFYERTDDGTWDSFRPFHQLPNVPWDTPNLRFIDLDGDGHADLLISEHEVFTWYPSLGEEGFAAAIHVRPATDEERGPRLVLVDRTQTIFLADMSGDGLTDLVRIRNGEICYWPNHGHGRFGAKVTMDDAPWLDSASEFVSARIRLADIDGSGTTDLIYLASDGPRLYFNRSGNGWSSARRLAQSPPPNNVASVATVDLLGNGTTCLVWSSPLPADRDRPIRFIDLTGGTKPHLLTHWTNNLGAETVIAYAPSSKFYLADKHAGTPWIARLPFVVHVVERIETYDRIGRNRFVTRYVYHHGRFDGTEREFRGFGLVETIDTEEIGALNASGTFPTGSNFAASSHVPPVLTRTWFHTGVFLGRDRVSNFHAGEYFHPPGIAAADALTSLLDDTVLPAGLTADEEREACRALKGSMLRREIYARDGSAKQNIPYSVLEQNFTIAVVQRRGANRHAVFFTHPREAINYVFERNVAPAPDPRVTHKLTLEVDRFGNVLKSADVAYGRRVADPLLPTDDDRARQALVIATYTETDVTNHVDEPHAYRTPVPCDARTFELTGLVLPVGRSRFTMAEILAAGAAGTLVEQVRTIYRRDNLDGAVMFRHLESRALPFQTLKLAFTPALLAALYGGRVTNAMLEDEGRYVHSEGDANWWIPSGRVFYSPDPAHSAAQELDFARQHFFHPHRFRDAFHTNLVSTDSFVSYDAYDLLILETRDAVGNRTTVGERDGGGAIVVQGNDYRVLQPRLVMEPNRNRTAIAFDAFALVAGTAVMGKPEAIPAVGDHLNAFRADLTQGEIDQVLSDPKGALAAALLAGATSRLVYDLGAYWRESDPQKKPPATVVSLVRETHAGDPVPAGGLRIETIVFYSDGFGREIQRKRNVEAGPVPQRDAEGRIILGADQLPVMTAADVAPRWTGSGWTVFNNKGKAVRTYEPFFTDTHRFEFDVRIGQSPLLFYDPLDRIVATLHSDHAWEKVVFDAWREARWDVSDTVLIGDPSTDPDVGAYLARIPAAEYLPTWFAIRDAGGLGADEQRAARKTAVHAATPALAHADALGRMFLTVAHNKFKYSDTAPAAPPVEEFHAARLVLDVESNQREVFDAQNRLVIRYDYDLAGNRIHQASMESGERWSLGDVAGKALYAWDSLGRRLRTEYDTLRRHRRSFLLQGAGAEVLVGETTYGESAPNPEASNLRAKTHQIFDQAGVVITDQYDFKGNLRRSERRLAVAHDATLDWSGVVALELQPFVSQSEYDALNRVTATITPDGSITRQTYNEGGLPETIGVHLRGAAPLTTFVSDIDYDAKGQRTLVDNGNGVRTTFEYDERTSRLINALTRRGLAAFPDDDPQPPDAQWPGANVRNLHYTYDAIGNIAAVADAAQQRVFFGNKRVDASCDYTYDAVGRLIEATGREHLGGAAPVPHSYNDAPRVGIAWAANDGNALGRYLERYVYDEAGNFLEMQHLATDPAAGNWTRTYTYNEISQLEPGRHSNRVTSTTIGALDEIYSVAGNGYDAHGNFLRMPHLQAMQWDFRDQLRMTARQAVNAGDLDGQQHAGERTWYVYDSNGERVRKATEFADGTLKEEWIFLGRYELYRRRGADPLVRENLHVLDLDQRVAIVETRVNGVEPGIPLQQIRYQYSDHLGSSRIELDENAEVLSYEEYTPYGSTAYQAIKPALRAKRYRHTGAIRDDENGFTYHSARYCAPWLGRWISPDPAGLIDGPNLYRYARNSPVVLRDPSGKDPDFRTFTDRSIQINLDYNSTTQSVSYSLSVELQDPETGDRFYYTSSGDLQGLRSVHNQLLGNSGFAAALRPEEREGLFQSLERFAESVGPVDAPGPTERDGPVGELPQLTDGPRLPRVADRTLRVVGDVARGIEADRVVPQRYRLEPPRGATVTGIRDTHAGAVRGTPPRPVGAPAIRVDRPHGRTNFPHINLEVVNPDPHLRISPSTLRTLSGVARGLETAGRIARPVAIVTDAARLGAAIYEDQGIGRNTARTAASVAGGWGGAFAGAWGGAKVGVLAGAAIGGPVGAAIGGVVGGLIGGIAGGLLGSWGAESAADAIMR